MDVIFIHHYIHIAFLHFSELDLLPHFSHTGHNILSIQGINASYTAKPHGVLWSRGRRVGANAVTVLKGMY